MSTSAPPFDVFHDFRNTINGVLSTTASTRQAINPATSQPLGPVPVSTNQHVQDAMHAAQAAFGGWSRTPWADRRGAVCNFADAVQAYSGDLARLLTLEQGKPLAHATGEIQGSATWMRAFAALELRDSIVKEDDKQKIIVRHVPLGVVLAITPWNFPAIQVLLKITAAVVTGNAVVVKPSPFTPYCALKVGELAQRFFPPGVVQVLSGGDDLGPLLANHPVPAKIAFTGI